MDHGGTVTAYDPGTFDPAALERGERVTVGGHPAYWVPTLTGEPLPPAEDSSQQTRNLAMAAVGWQDTSGVWVTVSDTASREALMRLAAAVRLGPPRQITAPVQFGWVPGGFPLSYASSTDESGGITGLSSTVGFAASRPPAAVPEMLFPMQASSGLALSVLTVPKTSRGWTELVDPEGAPPGKVPTPQWKTIGGQRAWYLPDSAQPQLFAAGPGAHLLIDAGDCGVLIRIGDLGQVSYDELVRTVAAMTFSSCTDAASWRPVVS